MWQTRTRLAGPTEFPTAWLRERGCALYLSACGPATLFLGIPDVCLPHSLTFLSLWHLRALHAGQEYSPIKWKVCPLAAPQISRLKQDLSRFP